jgi:hypothetical protein
VRRFLRPQHPHWMRIESHDHRASSSAARIRQRALDHRAMPEMHPIEDTDREEHWPRHAARSEMERSGDKAKTVHRPRCRTLPPTARDLPHSVSATSGNGAANEELGSEANESRLCVRVSPARGEEARADTQQGRRPWARGRELGMCPGRRDHASIGPLPPPTVHSKGGSTHRRNGSGSLGKDRAPSPGAPAETLPATGTQVAVGDNAEDSAGVVPCRRKAVMP